MRAVVAEIEAALPAHACPCWAGSNHDIGRLATRWAKGDDDRARCALVILLGLRGTPCLYYGDELALEEGAVPDDRIVDCATPPRDPGRTPMPWTAGGEWREPWLPLADASRNVEDQRADPGSTLHFTRDLIALRRGLPALQSGAYTEIPAPAGAWAWRRGTDVLVAVNLADAPVELEGISGGILIATNRSRDGELVDSLTLAAGEAAIVAPSQRSSGSSAASE
jgi:alpha-glucosidase